MKLTSMEGGEGMYALVCLCRTISTTLLLLAVQNVHEVDAISEVWTPYDPTAYSEVFQVSTTTCYSKPKNLLYGGGIIMNPDFSDGLKGWFAMGNCNLQVRHEIDDDNAFMVATNRTASYNGPAQTLSNLTRGVKYTVSAWLQVKKGTSTPFNTTIKATLTTLTSVGREFKTIGTVVAKNGCWTFLKGGFVLQNAPLDPFNGQLYFETYELITGMEIWLDRVSVQPFTDVEWRSHQNAQREMLHRRSVKLRVVDSTGRRVHGAKISLVDVKPKFYFGTAITKYFLSNKKYQEWLAAKKGFNVAVVGNEMKWYWNEPSAGVESWSDADALVSWCQSHGIALRGHNVIWEDPTFVQPWLKSLSTTTLLAQALGRRLSHLLRRYPSLLSWDMSNEQLHFSFFETALHDPHLSTHLFLAAQSFFSSNSSNSTIPPPPLLFVNDYNTLEQPDDLLASPDAYLATLRRLLHAGVSPSSLAIGLESHFGPNPPDVAFIRSTLDRLSTSALPIWLTELDVHVRALGNNLTQAATYLEDVLRECFSHPSVQGIVMWASIDDASGNCWRMCLTDTNMTNLPTGNVVDRLLQEWLQVDMLPLSSPHHDLQWRGPVGWHTVSVQLPSDNTTYQAILTVSRGHDTQHFLLQMPDANSSTPSQLLVFPDSAAA